MCCKFGSILQRIPSAKSRQCDFDTRKAEKVILTELELNDVGKAIKPTSTVRSIKCHLIRIQ
jgi:hypothetical protein